MEFFNTPEMEWFIDTPNVKSYEQQMEIRERFLKVRHRYQVEINGPGWKEPAKWGERGVDVVFPHQWESWVEAKPATWTKCQSSKPYPKEILENGLGEPGIHTLPKRDLVFHVNPQGRVDSFRIMPIGFTRYTVTRATKCWLEPGGMDAKVDPCIPFRPNMSAPSNGQEVACTSGRFAGVIVGGQACFLEYSLVTKAAKQDYSPPKDWTGYTDSVVLLAQSTQ
jgi:hypothetical protein